MNPVTPTVGQAATAVPNATDATSGVAAQSCAAPDTSTAGTRTVACSATDTAGNQATQTLTYTVAANPTFKASKSKVFQERQRLVPPEGHRHRQGEDHRQVRRG